MIGFRESQGLGAGAVINASVAVKWFVPQQWTVDAHSVFQTIAVSEVHRFVVPEVFFAEVLSALKRSRDELDSIHAAVEVVSHLPLQTVRWQDGPRTRAVDLALGNLGAYDAIYAAIAIDRSIPLLTSDARLARALGEPPWVVLLP